VKHLLGSGSAGDTWLCEERGSGDVVAIKLIRRPIPPVMGTSIMREVKIGAELGKGHLNIVKPREVVLTRLVGGVIWGGAGRVMAACWDALMCLVCVSMRVLIYTVCWYTHTACGWGSMCVCVCTCLCVCVCVCVDGKARTARTTAMHAQKSIKRTAQQVACWAAAAGARAGSGAARG
jgi:serine/threonine protein kinase